jgi:hypothetical protein
MDRIDPADPIDKMEPAEPIDRIEPDEPMLRIEPAEPAEPDELRFMRTFSQHGAGCPEEDQHVSQTDRGRYGWL